MNPPTITPSDRYCALFEYQLDAGCPDAVIGQWHAVSNNPFVVDSVVFSSPNNPVTKVTAPSETVISFYFECCK